MATIAEVCRGGYGGRVSFGCPRPGDVVATCIHSQQEREGGDIAHGRAVRRMRVVSVIAVCSVAIIEMSPNDEDALCLLWPRPCQLMIALPLYYSTVTGLQII
jgi:hypothetical protein